MKLPFRPYEGQEPYVFADFSHQDDETVFPLLNAMNQNGYRTWYDEGLHWAEDWADNIAARIKNCHVGVVFLSQYVLLSKHRVAEVYYLRKNNKPIITVCLEAGIELPAGLQMYLRDFPLVTVYEDETIDNIMADLSRVEILIPCKAAQKEAG